MNDQFKNFGETAKSLARNPLGIIALFIVLVYGFASLVTAFAGSFTASERLPLIYFLIFFPVLVLGVFAWLVSRHSGMGLPRKNGR
jgi:cytochrome c oxidase subunit IV